MPGLPPAWYENSRHCHVSAIWATALIWAVYESLQSSITVWDWLRKRRLTSCGESSQAFLAFCSPAEIHLSYRSVTSSGNSPIYTEVLHHELLGSSLESPTVSFPLKHSTLFMYTPRIVKECLNGLMFPEYPKLVIWDNINILYFIYSF